MESGDGARTKFTRRENIRFALAVAVAICTMTVGMATVPVSGVAWLDDMIRLAFLGGGLIAVMTVAVKLFGNAEDRKLLREDHEMLKDIHRAHKIMETYLPAIAKALGAKVPPLDTAVDNDDDHDDDNKPGTGR